jgi:protoporphyrinogen oxidase
VDLFAEAPGEVRQAAQALDYCSAVLLFLKVNRRNVLPSAMLYFSDPNIPFSRIYDVGMYSSAMVPDGKTMICLEFPCNLGDAIWLDSEANIGKIAIEILAREGVLSQEDVDGFFIEKISHSYPRFRLGFQKRVQQCFGFFARFENFISFGRQGSFAYLNTDGVINLGFNAADAVILSESMGYRCHEWFTAKTKIGH